MPTEAILHNLTPDRVVFCYRKGDDDSLEVAQYYASRRGLDSDQLIALPCSSENIISQSEFIIQIENPLLEAIGKIENAQASSSSAQIRQIWVIILGHHIPHGYWPDVDPYDPYSPYLDLYVDPYSGPKAIASRLHRLGQSEVSQYPNFTFDRRGAFKFFDATDAQNMYITAVLDGPSKETVLELIDRSLDISQQSEITGKLYVDPYGNNTTSAQKKYESLMLDFVEKEVPNLGLATSVTVRNPTSTSADPTVVSLSNDSFYWGWFLSRYASSLFLSRQNQRRVFLYNADDEAGNNISAIFDPNGSDRWVNVALDVDPRYASAAGAMSDPGEANYLHPRPFFEALHRGSSLGEAFLFSSPSVDWKIFLVGDPLMTVAFAKSVPNHQNPVYTQLPNNEVIRATKEHIEESLAYGFRQARLLDDLIQFNVLSTNIEEEIRLLYGLNNWSINKNSDVQRNIFAPMVTSLVEYILQSTGMNLPAWLESQGERVSGYLASIATEVSSSLILPPGEWKFEFVYTHIRQTLENINFNLQLSRYDDFRTIEVDVRSSSSKDGWEYEKEPFAFSQMEETGFGSNFSGRKARYTSTPDLFLRTTEIYYARWQPVDTFNVPISDFISGGAIIIRN